MKFSYLKIIFILITSNYAFSQKASYNDLVELTTTFEKELLFSNKKAKAIALQIDSITRDTNKKEFRAISNYTKALEFLKIKKNLDSAKLYAKHAYDDHVLLKDTLYQFKDINLLYRCFSVENKRDSAFFYATKALEFSKLTLNPLHQVRANLDMGDVYYLNRQHDKVKLYRNKALFIAKKYDLKRELSDIHLKIAQSHLKLSEQRTQKVLDSAIYHAKKSLYNAKQANYNYGVYKSTVVLADFLNVNKQSHEALKLIETITKLPDDEIPLNYKYTTAFYHAVILKDNKKYEQAKKIAKQLLASTRAKDYSRKKSLNFFLSVLYAHNKQPDSTDYAIKQAVIANNSQSELRFNESIAKLQTQYETKEKELEIKNLEQKEKINQLEINDLQRQRLILGYSLLIPVIIIIAGGWYINRRRLKLQLETEQKEYAVKMSELKALRSQMNPHFLFNAINSVQSLVLKDKKDDAYDYLTKLSHLIREILNFSDKTQIYLDEEIEQLTNYLELEKLRFKKDFSYQITIDEALNSLKIPSMIIQPFVENAIKHGLLHKEGDKNLSVTFNMKDKILECIIEDNGVGRKASEAINKLKPDYQKSFSTGAIQKRFELYQQHLEQHIGFEYEDLYQDDKATGTRATIIIPFLTDED